MLEIGMREFRFNFFDFVENILENYKFFRLCDDCFIKLSIYNPSGSKLNGNV
jgi:hypothetical protein